jgi:hypothetical protein
MNGERETWEREDQLLHEWAEERSTDAASAEDSRRFATLVEARLRERRRARVRQAILVVAALVLLAVSLTLRERPTRPAPGHEALVVYSEGETVAGEHTLAVNGDGRLVTRLGPDLLAVDGHSEVSVRNATEEEVLIRLDRGTVAAHVEPRTGGERFNVIVGDRTVVVRGTRFAVTRLPEGDVVVVVDEGQVDVMGLPASYHVTAPRRLRVDPRGSGEFTRLRDDDRELDRLLSVEPWVPAEALAPAREEIPDIALLDVGQRPAPSHAVATPPSLEDLRHRLLADDPDTALADLEALVAADPDHVDAWALLATARRRSGDSPGAIEAWREVVSRGSGSDASRARYEAAVILQAQPDGHAEAVVLLEAFLDSPEGLGALEGDARLRLARSLRALGREDEARAALQDVIQRFPGTAPATAARGMLETSAR